ncbi:hypothetical protein P170DRAFT_424071 [Aspergillus steynii IBT 23096]|uniref:Uncharacterized protein n=1 Tax=Aspergillus steynii IBT 23096 TaxID=1392250 RepID=A0A2I2GKB4_9EURO|nr:uncharacterized protein P170DRAFT_424071 [Aspergillus steynii IBT 23096]PLB53316.1 hypothetical protein P170DRAFT_424071 [Aspergillus steynii IBT 23096]
MEVAPENVPEGWTNDPERLNRTFRPNSRELYLARCHGLEGVRPVLVNTPSSGEMGFIITSGGHYYIGDKMGDYIYEIKKPNTLPAIVRVMAEEGEKALKCRKLKFVEWVRMDSPEPPVESEGPRLFVPYSEQLHGRSGCCRVKDCVARDS